MKRTLVLGILAVSVAGCDYRAWADPSDPPHRQIYDQGYKKPDGSYTTSPPESAVPPFGHGTAKVKVKDQHAEPEKPEHKSAE